VPAYNNLIGFFVANNDTKGNGTLFAHFEWRTDVRAEPLQTALFRIEPHVEAMIVANFTLAPTASKKTISSTSPLYGTYTVDTNSYGTNA
jgi:hypothetical protein